MTTLPASARKWPVGRRVSGFVQVGLCPLIALSTCHMSVERPSRPHDGLQCRSASPEYAPSPHRSRRNSPGEAWGKSTFCAVQKRTTEVLHMPFRARGPAPAIGPLVSTSLPQCETRLPPVVGTIRPGALSDVLALFLTAATSWFLRTVAVDSNGRFAACRASAAPFPRPAFALVGDWAYTPAWERRFLMARFEAPLEDDGLNESQPRPVLDGEPAAILDGSPEIEDLIEDARALYLETVESPSRYVN